MMHERMVVVDRVLWAQEWTKDGNNVKAHMPGAEIPLLEYERLMSLQANKGSKAKALPLAEENLAPVTPKAPSDLSYEELKIRARLAGVQFGPHTKREQIEKDLAEAEQKK